MKAIERVVRVMTHVNIGAALGMTAWLLWSGYQAVSGDRERPSPQRTSPSPAADGVAQPVSLPCCFIEAPAREAKRVEAMAPRAVQVAAGETSP